jgi:predicted RNA-binding protein YlxR (DUF448 family)
MIAPHSDRAPIRTCVGCGTRDHQRGLVRLRIESLGLLSAATPGGSGRSAYVHPRRTCIERVSKRRLLARSLASTPVPQQYESLLDRLHADPTVVISEA